MGREDKKRWGIRLQIGDFRLQIGTSPTKDAIELYIESLVARGDTVPTEENTFEYPVAVLA